MKIKKKMIEILWSVMGGLIFSMLPYLFNSGQSDYSPFNLERWYRGLGSFGGSLGLLDEFIFGFFFTLILIWSIKKYRQPSEESNHD